MLLYFAIWYTIFRPASPRCGGGFDIYFILDKSRSLRDENFQVQTVEFVSHMTEMLYSPTTRISLITFSDKANLDLELTRDPRKIQNGLSRLKKIVPFGRTHLEYGLRLAYSQIKEKGRTTASIIVISTDGELANRRAEKSYELARKLRNQLAVTIFTVGIAKYKWSQLHKLASEPTENHVYTATNFDFLKEIADKIIATACIEVTDVKPNSVCVGKSYDVILYGKGFTKTGNVSAITCNFRYNNTIDHVTTPTEISDTQLKCRAPVLETEGSFVLLQVSLTRDKFISSDIRVVGVLCIKPDYTKTILTALIILIIFALLLLWWFYLLLPCVEVKKPPPIYRPSAPDNGEPTPPERGSKKWPKVDASFYGARGVGGITPVRVKWGDKGATEEGQKLMKTPDANVIDQGQDELHEEGDHKQDSVNVPQVNFLKRLRIFFNLILVGLNNFLGLVLKPYISISSFRPRKDGKSKLYSSKSERSTF